MQLQSSKCMSRSYNAEPRIRQAKRRREKPLLDGACVILAVVCTISGSLAPTVPRNVVKCSRLAGGDAICRRSLCAICQPRVGAVHV